MVLFLVAFGWPLCAAFQPGFRRAAIVTRTGTAGSYNGWVLAGSGCLAGVFSYPAHDPVMMDRGFIADPDTTRRSSARVLDQSRCASWFGVFGIQAGLSGAAYEGELIGTWADDVPAMGVWLLMVSLLVRR